MSERQFRRDSDPRCTMRVDSSPPRTTYRDEYRARALARQRVPLNVDENSARFLEALAHARDQVAYERQIERERSEATLTDPHPKIAAWEALGYSEDK